MADHAFEDDNDGDIFVYRDGGRAPQHEDVTHVRIDKSIDAIEDAAFSFCRQLVKVETHNGIRTVGSRAFFFCKLLRHINLKSVSEINIRAFEECVNLVDVEVGDNLQTINESAFAYCSSLRHLKLPSVITIKAGAFMKCKRLEDIELSERLETVEEEAFWGCERLRRIAIPPKRNLFDFHPLWEVYNHFEYCEQLTTVDLVGGIHNTVASLHMDSWRTEMIAEIDRINQALPNTPSNEKTDEIRLWMESVLDKFDHYKAEHHRHVKEGVTLLELALWKAKLGEKEESREERTKKAKIDAENARKERRITCGADTVIKHVLPYLQLD